MVCSHFHHFRPLATRNTAKTSLLFELWQSPNGRRTRRNPRAMRNCLNSKIDPVLWKWSEASGNNTIILSGKAPFPNSLSSSLSSPSFQTLNCFDFEVFDYLFLSVRCLSSRLFVYAIILCCYTNQKPSSMKCETTGVVVILGTNYRTFRPQ